MGLAEIGPAKFKSAPCPTPEEAKSSAANVANIAMKPVSFEYIQKLRALYCMLLLMSNSHFDAV